MVPSSRNLVFLLNFAIIISCVKSQNAPDLDKLIEQVFNMKSGDTASSTTVTNSPRNPEPVTESSGIPGTNSCTCVPYYLCKNGSIIINGENLIDIRIQDGPCQSYLDFCCGKEDQLDNTTTVAPPIDKKKGCGYRNPEGIGFRITGATDNEAQFGEFPWMVAVLREESVQGNPQKLNVYQCGGSLIHPQVVLTAGHCVNDKTKQFKIRAGEWDTQTKKEMYPFQERDVESIIIHPQYYSGALYNDIALLFLKTPVEIAENVNTICLPPANVEASDVRCYATGWGKDVFGKEGKYQVILKKIDLPMMERQQCQDALRSTRLGKYFELHSSFVCAGGEPGKDTCKGDGGSPLVCPIKGSTNRFAQAGIVAWGIGCGEKGIPGVYANVAMFRQWVDEQLQAKGIDITTYQF